MEDEVRYLFSRWLRKKLAGVSQGVSGKMILLVRYQDGCEKDLNLNQLTIITLEEIPLSEESKVPTISLISYKTIDF